MSEATRQRWLHVRNRLEELYRKYGPVVDRPLPPWLDTSDGYLLVDVPAEEAAEAAAIEEPPEVRTALAAVEQAPPSRSMKRRRRRGSDW